MQYDHTKTQQKREQSAGIELRNPNPDFWSVELKIRTPVTASPGEFLHQFTSSTLAH